MHYPEYLVVYIFIIGEREARRRFLSFLSRRPISIIISSPRLGREVSLSSPIWSGQDYHSRLEKYFQYNEDLPF